MLYANKEEDTSELNLPWNQMFWTPVYLFWDSVYFVKTGFHPFMLIFTAIHRLYNVDKTYSSLEKLLEIKQVWTFVITQNVLDASPYTTKDCHSFSLKIMSYWKYTL